jgi:ubiquinone biosynthesis protein
LARSLTSFSRTYRNLRSIRRLRNIVTVLLRHGFGQLVEQLDLLSIVTLGNRLRIFKESRGAEHRFTLAERLRLVFEDLGPTYIKLGQLLSMRPDLVSPAVSEELRKLQENVPPIPLEQAREVIERSLRKPVAELFATLDPEPLASASIGQVHTATLKDGTEVIVKVQRPGIEPLISSDLTILYTFAQLLERHVREAEHLRPVQIVDEFSRAIRKELDYTLEASNAEVFHQNFRGDPQVKFPEIYWDLSTRQVLTMERLHGVSALDTEQLQKWGLDLAELARRGGTIFLRMVLEHGYFHADPHAGNFCVLQDGRFGLVDFGMVGRLDTTFRESLASVVLALLARDYDRLTHEFVSMGILSPDVDLRNFRRDLLDLIEPYFGRPLGRIPFGPVFQRIVELSFKYSAQRPPELYLLARAIVLVEGLGRQLDPGLDLVALGQPFAVELLRERISPRSLAQQAWKMSFELNELAKVLPREVRGILAKLGQGELRLGLKSEDAEGLLRQMRKSGFHISLALVVAGLLVSSALVATAPQPPQLSSLPLLAALGYGLAVLAIVWLLLRAGRG